jgi:hypothetical protein
MITERLSVSEIAWPVILSTFFIALRIFTLFFGPFRSIPTVSLLSTSASSPENLSFCSIPPQ